MVCVTFWFFSRRDRNLSHLDAASGEHCQKKKSEETTSCAMQWGSQFWKLFQLYTSVMKFNEVFCFLPPKKKKKIKHLLAILQRKSHLIICIISILKIRLPFFILKWTCYKHRKWYLMNNSCLGHATYLSNHHDSDVVWTVFPQSKWYILNLFLHGTCIFQKTEVTCNISLKVGFVSLCLHFFFSNCQIKIDNK